MGEPQPVRVQELAPEREVVRDPVRHVTGNRQLDRAQMNADLVCSSRLEPDVEERVLR